MIAIFKLEKLHRAQRLRKIASVFAAAERRLCSGAASSCASGASADARGAAGAEGRSSCGSGAGISASEYRYFSDIAKMLSRDSLFAQPAQEAFAGAAEIFALVAAPGKGGAGAAREAACGSGVSESGELAGAAAARRALNGARHILLAETGRSQADWDFLDGDGRLDPARRQAFIGMHVYLDDIRSPFNVGAMFRSAESFGAEKIFVSPFCADPNHPRAKRTAMGCVDALPWERLRLFGGECAAPDRPIFALETGGIPLADFPFPRQGLLVVGSEELGVSPQALAAADASLGRVSIPSFGAKGSLNASVAFGIAMQAWAAHLAGAL